MDMVDIYLRAETEAELVAALPWAREQDGDADPHWATGGEGWALDIIGPVVIAAGSYDDDGAELAAPVIDRRCHANLRCTPEIADSIPTGVRIAPPETPARVWAGTPQE